MRHLSFFEEIKRCYINASIFSAKKYFLDLDRVIDTMNSK
jgi:hypothetical protein